MRWRLINMKKKTLIILLIVPFIVGLLSFVSAVILKNTVAVDILDIVWDYKEQEGFKIDADNPYKLNATPVVDANLKLADGNSLVWSMKNIDDSDNEYARIEQKDNSFYLFALSEGQIQINCQNERGTKSKSFDATIYENGTILINPLHKASGNSISKGNRVYGVYDPQYTSLKEGNLLKNNAKIEISSTLLYEGEESNDVYLKSKSDNLSYNNNVITINSSGESYITLSSSSHSFIETTYKFNALDNAFNIYNYNDLMKVTNFSNEANNVVMQTNLESLKHTYKTNAKNEYEETYLNSNTKLFGNYDFKNKTFSFEDEIVKKESTYSTKYIDQFNKSLNKNYEKSIVCGIDLKGNLYGNGFTINAHELAYPTHGDKSSGILTPGKLDLFKGPLAYVTIGGIDSSVVKAYGEDNTLIYVDKDNITVDNVKLKNTNDLDNMYDLIYTGTVMNITKNNCTVKNSILSNSKNIIHAYSSDNLLIDNSILKNAAEFILEAGSNRYNEVNDNKDVFITTNKGEISGKLSTVFNNTSNNNSVDSYISKFLMEDDIGTTEEAYNTLNKIQDSLNNESTNVDANITVKDTKFYNSGIFSIALTSMFNGVYLYNGMPSIIKDKLGGAVSSFVFPDHIGGTSIPIKLSLEGSTTFYDFKDIEKIDMRSLLYEAIGPMLEQLGIAENVSINDFYPMKAVLKQLIFDNKLNYLNEDVNYINTCVAWYGGGKNNNSIDTSKLTGNTFSDYVNADMLKLNLEGKYMSSNRYIRILSRCVLCATGFEPFKYLMNAKNDHETYGKAPTIDELINNAK